MRISPRTMALLAILLPALAYAGTPSTALERRVQEVSLTGVALTDAIDYLRDISAVNLHVNWRALEGVGITRDTPINIRVRGISLRKVLNLILTEASGGTGEAAFYVADGVVEITTRELADGQMITRVYPIDDLLVEVPDFDNAPDFNLDSAGGKGGGSPFSGSGGSEKTEAKSRAERAEEIVDLIVSTIEPDLWSTNGGKATIRFFGGSLVVTAPRSIHEALGGPVD